MIPLPRSGAQLIERTVRSLRNGIERTSTAEPVAARRGVLQRIDPRVKLVGLLALIVCVTLAAHLLVIAAVLTLAVLLAAMSSRTVLALVVRVSIPVLAFTIIVAAPALVLTAGDVVLRMPIVGWPVTKQGLTTASYLIMRAATCATLACLLVFTTPWAHVLKSLRTFRVPAVFVVVLAMAYRYVLLLLETSHDMFQSQRSRAAGALPRDLRRTVTVSTAGVLLSRTFQLSDDVYLAMQARGFRGDVRVLDDFRMTARDWIALAGFGAAVLAAWWAGR